MSLKQRFIIALIIFFSLIVGIFLLALVQMKQQEASIRDIYLNKVKTMDRISAIANRIAKTDGAVLEAGARVMLGEDPDKTVALIQTYRDILDTPAEQLAQLIKETKLEGDTFNKSVFEADLNAFKQILNQTAVMAKQSDAYSIMKLSPEAKTLNDKILASLSNIIRTQSMLTEQTYLDLTQSTQKSISLLSGLLVLLVILLLFLAVYMQQRVSKPIENTVSAMIHYVNQLRTISEKVVTATQTLSGNSSSQIRSFDAIVSKISRTLDGISDAVKHNSTIAKQSNEMAVNVCETAINSRESLSNMIATVNQIKVSSGFTAKILKTIDDIAFQTNILALNAAVEAARAGEYGQSFSVVAEEVRRLALRSTDAAKDTSEQIEESSRQANHSVEASQNLSVILEDMISKIQKLTAVISQVTEITIQQGYDIETIHQNIKQIDSISNLTAASTQELSAISEQLRTQAMDVDTLITRLSLIIKTNG